MKGIAYPLELDLEKLKGNDKQVCEGLFKIIQFNNPEIAKKLDIDEIAASRLRTIIKDDLYPFLKTVK